MSISSCSTGSAKEREVYNKAGHPKPPGEEEEGEEALKPGGAQSLFCCSFVSFFCVTNGPQSHDGHVQSFILWAHQGQPKTS